MLRIHRHVYRVLQPGAIYAFNVFDYFDNERIITFSAMGNKRVALSALFVDLFRRIGFKLYGNITWDKGDIEGKRSYNAGNFSPFYQAPFNCWEHVLLFQKPGVEGDPAMTEGVACANKVLRIKPVYKIVRGVNVHGHSAPFPIELPASVLQDIPRDSLVLDPFGGSGTTARAALDRGLRAIIVELNPDYCMLAEKLIKEHEAMTLLTSQTQTLF
jgi:DNA modification methylase